MGEQTTSDTGASPQEDRSRGSSTCWPAKQGPSPTPRAALCIKPRPAQRAHRRRVLPPPAPLALVLVGQHGPGAGLAADGDVAAGVQVVDGHALATRRGGGWENGLRWCRVRAAQAGMGRQAKAGSGRGARTERSRRLTMTRRKFQTSAEEMLDSGLYLRGRAAARASSRGFTAGRSLMLQAQAVGRAGNHMPSNLSRRTRVHHGPAPASPAPLPPHLMREPAPPSTPSNTGSTSTTGTAMRVPGD